MAHKLLLLTKDNEQYSELINKCALPGLILLNDEPGNIKQADIWLADPLLAAPIIGHGTNLKWLQSTYSGVAPLIKPRLRKDYQLTNIKGIFGSVVSEYIFSSILFHQQKKHYQDWLPVSYQYLKGKSILLLGTGSIAKLIASTAKFFGMTVLAINKDATPVENIDKIADLTFIEPFIEKSDVVINLLPSTHETQGVLNKKILMKLKSNAVLFNLGLEDAIDLHALNTQLKRKPEQRAIIDVFNQEPLANSHPLRQRGNITITPYIPSPSFPEQVLEIFSKNYHRYINAQPLENKILFNRET